MARLRPRSVGATLASASVPPKRMPPLVGKVLTDTWAAPVPELLLPAPVTAVVPAVDTEAEAAACEAAITPMASAAAPLKAAARARILFGCTGIPSQYGS